eukprot:scaffold36532_cov118-Isochrysis_galbana.AAC.5
MCGATLGPCAPDIHSNILEPKKKSTLNTHATATSIYDHGTRSHMHIGVSNEDLLLRRVVAAACRGVVWASSGLVVVVRCALTFSARCLFPCFALDTPRSRAASAKDPSC